MAPLPVETAVVYWPFRQLPASMAGPFALTLEESRVVDYFLTWDMLTGFFPPQLWVPEIVPAADFITDSDSLHDPLVLLGFAAASAPGLGMMLGGTNSARVGPAEVFRAGLSLASSTTAPTIVALGAGEAYNITPFGYKRSDSLRRMEDHFRLYKRFASAGSPFDFEGHVWRYEQVQLGNVNGPRPQFWVMGAGPRLTAIGVRHADGWCTGIPAGFATPDAFAGKVCEMKRELERHGRDPGEFGFGIQAITLVHEDADVLERALENPLAKFIAGALGRFDQAEWRREGHVPLFPDDWSYSIRMLPQTMSDAEVKRIVDGVTPEMVRATFICGSPKEVAERLLAYAEAGMTLCCPVDFSGLTLPFAEFPGVIDRQVQICRILKSADDA